MLQTEEMMKYFAYGSNMSVLRLQARVPSAKKIAVVMLKNHQLRFNMSGIDGSGKCDCFMTNNSDDFVLGVLFEIDVKEKHILDNAESLGTGYFDKMVSVEDGNGNAFEALIYCALRIDNTLQPFSWYLYHVIFGAKKANISADYIAAIENVQCIEDPNQQRELKELAIYKN
jgi:hypothetical protein